MMIDIVQERTGLEHFSQMDCPGGHDFFRSIKTSHYCYV